MLGFIDRVAWGRANISEHLEHWKQFFSNFFFLRTASFWKVMIRRFLTYLSSSFYNLCIAAMFPTQYTNGIFVYVRQLGLWPEKGFLEKGKG